MAFSAHRVLILLICIGLLSIQLDKVFGSRNVDFILRQSQDDQGIVPRNQRILKVVAMEGLNTEKKSAPVNNTFDPNQSSKRRVRILKVVAMEGMNTEKKSAPVNNTFDPNQSSKRRVRRGSDPIHNRS